jgi:hypothetical protein
MQTPLEAVRDRLEARKGEFTTNWQPIHQDVADHILPFHGRFLNVDTKPNDGAKRHDKTKNLDDTGEHANEILAAGLYGDMTSPARPWFRLGLEDKDLQEYAPVKVWLETTRRRMLYVFHKSNFYSSARTVYSELGGFGTAAMIEEEDFNTVVNFSPFTIGEYYIATDARGRVVAFYRHFYMRASSLVRTFGKNRVSDTVLRLISNNKGGEWVLVAHAIEKNKEYNDSIILLGAEGKAWTSMYWEVKADNEKKFLRVGGYDVFPVIVPRWLTIGSNEYGYSPGMKALGNVRMLQKLQLGSLEALDKMNNPPMNAPAALKEKGGNILSGGVNYIDPNAGQQSFAPAFQVTPDFQNIEFKVDRVQKAVERAFYVDLFQILSATSDGKERTAYEISKMHEEKLRLLGPVTENLHPEFLERTIDITFHHMEKAGLIPPPPPEIESMSLEVEYISLLAQAQKMVGTTAVEQLMQFVGGIMEAFPQVRHKIDSLEVVDHYSDMLGIPSKLIVPDEEVDRKIKAEEQAAQQEMQAQQLERTVAGAKTLSETKVGDGTALDGLLNGRAA